MSTSSENQPLIDESPNQESSKKRYRWMGALLAALAIFSFAAGLKSPFDDICMETTLQCYECDYMACIHISFACDLPRPNDDDYECAGLSGWPQECGDPRLSFPGFNLNRCGLLDNN